MEPFPKSELGAPQQPPGSGPTAKTESIFLLVIGLRCSYLNGSFLEFPGDLIIPHIGPPRRYDTARERLM